MALLIKTESEESHTFKFNISETWKDGMIIQATKEPSKGLMVTEKCKVKINGKEEKIDVTRLIAILLDNVVGNEINASVIDDDVLQVEVPKKHFSLASESSSAPKIPALKHPFGAWKVSPESFIFYKDILRSEKNEKKILVHDGSCLVIKAGASSDRTLEIFREFIDGFVFKLDEPQASVENGVLTVIVPKNATPSRLRFNIEVPIDC